MKIYSPDFENGGVIPPVFTCDGEDISPEIRWEGAPENAKSFVLIMDDPDAPVGTFTHWVVYDIPVNVNHIPRNFPKVLEVNGIKQGVNDFGRVGYGGPCPPRGHGFHRYFFKLYALDVPSLGLRGGSSRRDVERAMIEHVIGKAEFFGRYKRD